MKRYLSIFILLFICLKSNSQALPVLEIGKLNEAKVTTGLLLEKSFPLADLSVYDGSGHVTNTLSDWKQAYLQLYNSSLTPSNLSTYAGLMEHIHTYQKQHNTIPLGIIHYAYNTIDYNLSRISKEEVYTRDLTKIPLFFKENRVFLASVLQPVISSADVNFVITKEFFFSNLPAVQIDHFLVDFHDGQGFRRINWNEPFFVNQVASARIDVRTVILNTIDELNALVAKTETRINNLASVPPPHEVILLDPSNGINVNYANEPYTGKAYVLYADENDRRIKKPFIVTDGIDFGSKRDYYTDAGSTDDPRGLYQLANGDSKDGSTSSNLLVTLRQNCYDVILIDFDQGDGFIEGNGLLVAEFIKLINQRKATDKGLVIVGPSMGGLICRYALAKLEQDNIDHETETFFSFDSPQEGAHIPLGAQVFVQYFSITNAEAQDAETKLQSKAARSMLMSHMNSVEYTAPGMNTDGIGGDPDLYYDLMHSHLNTLGYPQKTRIIAMSNGNGDYYSRIYSDKLIAYDAFGAGGAKADVWGNNVRTDKKLFDAHLMGNFRKVFLKPNIPSVDDASGGLRDICTAINKKSTNMANTYGLPGPTCFIPTTSAFGVVLTPTSTEYSWFNRFTGDIPASLRALSPFDELYLTAPYNGYDEEHVKISPATRDWTIAQIMFNGYENFNSTSNIYVNASDGLKVYAAANKVVLASNNSNNYVFEAANNSKAIARAGKEVNLKPGFWAKSGANIHAYIISDVNCEVPGLIPEPQRKPENSIAVVNQEEEINSVKAYPNPTSDEITIKFMLPLDSKVNIELFSIHGNLIKVFAEGKSFQKGVNFEKIDLKFFPDRIYYCKIYSNTINLTIPLLKVK